MKRIRSNFYPFSFHLLNLCTVTFFLLFKPFCATQSNCICGLYSYATKHLFYCLRSKLKFSCRILKHFSQILKDFSFYFQRCMRLLHITQSLSYQQQSFKASYLIFQKFYVCDRFLSLVPKTDLEKIPQFWSNILYLWL